jgi:hypothetical protein
MTLLLRDNTLSVKSNQSGLCLHLLLGIYLSTRGHPSITDTRVDQEGKSSKIKVHG